MANGNGDLTPAPDPGGVIITAPDWFRDTFVGPRVFHETHRRDGVGLTYVEYTYDPYPSDTTIESIFIYFIEERGTLRVEQDSRTTGLLPLAGFL